MNPATSSGRSRATRLVVVESQGTAFWAWNNEGTGQSEGGVRDYGNLRGVAYSRLRRRRGVIARNEPLHGAAPAPATRSVFRIQRLAGRRAASWDVANGRP